LKARAARKTSSTVPVTAMVKFGLVMGQGGMVQVRLTAVYVSRSQAGEAGPTGTNVAAVEQKR